MLRIIKIMTNSNDLSLRRTHVASQNLWGLFFDVTRLVIGVTQIPCKLNSLRAGDIIPSCGCGGAIAGLIIVVTDFLGVVLVGK
jgi:hypothetical protein